MDTKASSVTRQGVEWNDEDTCVFVHMQRIRLTLTSFSILNTERNECEQLGATYANDRVRLVRTSGTTTDVHATYGGLTQWQQTSSELYFFPLRNHRSLKKFRSDDWLSYSERKSEPKKSNREPDEQLTAELSAFLANIWSIGARRTVVLTSGFCDLVTFSGGSRLSSQSKRFTSMCNVFSSPNFTALRISALLFFMFGSSLSLRYFLWSAMGLLRRN